MYYGYLSATDCKNQKIETVMAEFEKKNKDQYQLTVRDSYNNKENWRQRDLNKLLNENIKDDDTLVVYESSSLACSTTQILEILEDAAKQNYNVHFVKYSRTFKPSDDIDTLELIQFLMLLKSDFVAKRTTDIIARRRQEGLHIGRPKGSNNKQLKLDKHRETIEELLRQNVTRASIAKRIGCPAQTLYNYLEKRGIKVPS